jgi:DNA-damage-inducible protein J
MVILKITEIQIMDTTIQIRTDSLVKRQADSIFRQLGMTMSEGLNILLRQVIQHRGFPFPIALGPTGTKLDESYHDIPSYKSSAEALKMAEKMAGDPVHQKAFMALKGSGHHPDGLSGLEEQEGVRSEWPD